MARMPRLVVPGYPHHVTQRGNRRMKTFFHNGDYTGAQGAALMVDLANTVLHVGGGAVKLMTGQLSRQTAILETSLSAGGTVDLVNDLQELGQPRE